MLEVVEGADAAHGQALYLIIIPDADATIRLVHMLASMLSYT